MSGLPNVQENNEQILNDIQSLQQMEQQLFSNLESNPSLSPTQQQEIVEKMNQLSNMRISLYQTLSGVNSYFGNALNTTVGTLKEQEVAIDIVENELNNAKKRLQILEEEKNNKIRLVEINTYFGDKYAEHSNLMKIVIFTLIPVIILVFLNNKGILPNMIYYILIIIISFIGAYFFWRRFSSIILRDNMNYQEYDWYFNPSAAPTASGSSSSDPWASGKYGTCIGDNCCSNNMIYDASMNQCVISVTSNNSKSTSNNSSKVESFLTESMVDRVLTQKQPNKYNVDYNLRQPESFNNYR
jgi:hypothetical protein